jgi:hypothetical protein
LTRPPAEGEKPEGSTGEAVAVRRKSKNKTLQDIYAVGTIGRDKALDRVRKELLRGADGAPRPVSSADFQRMLELPDNTSWTAERQAELEQEGQDDPIRAEAMRLTLPIVADVRQLFKVVTYFYRCLPSDIIGIRTHMRVDPTMQHAAAKKLWHDSILWYSAFARNFIALVAHPTLQETHTLVMVLQLAVIARTDDRRTWRFSNWPGVPFLEVLLAEIKEESKKEAKDRRKIAELCEAAHGRATAYEDLHYSRTSARPRRARRKSPPPVVLSWTNHTSSTPTTSGPSRRH